MCGWVRGQSPSFLAVTHRAGTWLSPHGLPGGGCLRGRGSSPQDTSPTRTPDHRQLPSLPLVLVPASLCLTPRMLENVSTGRCRPNTAQVLRTPSRRSSASSQAHGHTGQSLQWPRLQVDSFHTGLSRAPHFSLVYTPVSPQTSAPDSSGGVPVPGLRPHRGLTRRCQEGLAARVLTFPLRAVAGAGLRTPYTSLRRRECGTSPASVPAPR